MKSLFRFCLTCALVLLLAPLVSFAARDDASLANGTLLTVDSLSFTVTGSNGALLDSIAVDSNTLTLVMSPDSRFQITSTDRRTITASGLASVKVTHTCSSSESVYLYENPSSAPSASTVTLTIDSGTCGAASGGGTPGGGGGGGGGGGASTPSARPQKVYPDGTIVFLDEAGGPEKAAKLDAKFAVTVAPVAPAAPKAAVSAPAAVSAISGNISRSLSKGTTNPQVKVLQQILNSDPDTRIAATGTGSPGNETSYFGPATVRAVQKFQVKYAIAKPGDSGYGNVGPLTRMILNAMAAKVPATVPANAPTTPTPAAPKATVSAPAAVSAISGNISRSLSKGTTNPQVKVLQQILNSDPDTRIAATGTGSPGNETSYFGPATVRAVQKFQVKYAIAKPGDSGYGNVGPLTRTILNSLAGKTSNPDQQIEDAMKQIKILQDQLKSQ